MTNSYMQITDSDGNRVWIDVESIGKSEHREIPVSTWDDLISSTDLSKKINVVLNLVKDSFSSIPKNMDSIEVEFGLILNYDQNFIIAKAGGKANLNIKVTIKQDNE